MGRKAKAKVCSFLKSFAEIWGGGGFLLDSFLLEEIRSWSVFLQFHSIDRGVKETSISTAPTGEGEVKVSPVHRCSYFGALSKRK